MERWLETDEYEEVRETLKALLHFHNLAKQDISYWKWVFIALHNAVQGCMVVALTGTDGMGALNPTIEKKRRTAWSKGEPQPREQDKLLRFLELYEKIQIPGSVEAGGGARFVSSESQDYSMKKLNEVRNEFIHFTPKGWYLDLSGAEQIVSDCLDIAEFLVVSSGRFFIFTSYVEDELPRLILKVRSSLSEK